MPSTALVGKQAGQPTTNALPRLHDRSYPTIVVGIPDLIGFMALTAGALIVIGTVVPFDGDLAANDLPFEKVYFLGVGAAVAVAGIATLTRWPRSSAGARAVTSTAAVAAGTITDFVLFNVAFEGYEPDLGAGFFAILGGGLLLVAAAFVEVWSTPPRRRRSTIPLFPQSGCLLTAGAYGLGAVLPRYEFDQETCCGISADLAYHTKAQDF